MTRPSALVLDGNEVRIRLQAERVASRTPVHVDWVRFTVLRRNEPAPSVDDLFPLADGDASTWERFRELDRMIREVPDCDQGAASDALSLAQDVAEALGDEFTVATEPRKGHDFYRFRLSIERHGAECGWVGFQASSDSPRQRAQARTLHVNLYGAACTFGALGWNHRLATVIDARAGTLTRCDLALDFFDGIEGGIERFLADYEAGAMDVCGKRLKANMVGDWTKHTKGARSLYVGSKEAGKQTNAYEKGDQLFGVESGSRWLRVELRYGNKLRELSSDMLREPASFFAGASEWHAALLREADAVQEVAPAPVRCRGRLPLETVRAEVARVLRWVVRTAGPSAALVLREAPESWLAELMGNPQRPGRLQRFGLGEIRTAMAQVLSTEGAGPAFAGS